MKFKKYNSIDNITNKAFEHFLSSDEYNKDIQWCVTEKVHGCNFSIYISSDGEIKAAKRNSFLDNDNFYNYQEILDRYDFSQFKDYIKGFNEEAESQVDYIILYGELCGGNYPGTKTPDGIKRIQKEIYYSNDHEFVIYDIAFHFIHDLPHNYRIEDYRFLEHDLVEYTCNSLGLYVLPSLFNGTLVECLEWSKTNLNKQSDVWKMLGMKKEVENNIREGHVIKPSGDQIFLQGDRVIFKDKNFKFRENSGAKTEKKIIKELSIELVKLSEIIDTYVCQNRFNNVISKYGEYTIRDFSNLLALMCTDIIKELSVSTEEFNNLDIQQSLGLCKIIKTKVSRYFVKNKKELF